MNQCRIVLSSFPPIRNRLSSSLSSSTLVVLVPSLSSQRALSTKPNHIPNNTTTHKHHSQRTSSNSSSSDATVIRYGTKVVPIPTPLPHPNNTPLTPYIHHSIMSSSSSHNNLSSAYDQFSILFFGTGGGGAISSIRNPCSTLLQLDGQAFLFDCGEGTQRQWGWSKARVGFKQLQKIFITHLHADHVLGLISLVLRLQVSHADGAGAAEQSQPQSPVESSSSSSTKGGNEKGSPRRKPRELETVELYGPPGLYNFLLVNVALTCSKLNHLKIVVYELMGGTEQEGPKRPWRWDQDTHRRPKNAFVTPLETHFRISNPRVERRVIHKDPKTNSWIISKASHPTSNNERMEYDISAAQVTHLHGVQTFGYMVQEPEPQMQIDVEKAKALGVRPSPKYRQWKLGKSVLSDDGSKMVAPEEVALVMEDGRRRKSRKFVYIGDNCEVSESMRQLSQKADILVHEATMQEGEEPVAIQRGHASALMAGKLAKDVGANLLVLNHFSGKANTQNDMDNLVESAQRQIDGNCMVTAAYDFVEISVPKSGYNFNVAS